jgi:hypothetical protein
MKEKSTISVDSFKNDIITDRGDELIQIPNSSRKPKNIFINLNEITHKSQLKIYKK